MVLCSLKEEPSPSRATGSVVLQVSALELLARYSMYSGRASSILSSLHEFRTKEVDQVGGKQWNWKYLRDQFDQKDLEGLYRNYDDKLRETLIKIYVTLLGIYSTIHMALVLISAFNEQAQWRSTYLPLGMYILRIAIPALCLCKTLYDALKKKWPWIPMVVTFVVTVNLVLTDITVAIYSSYEGMTLRPAYANISLLSVYIFLPMRNNFLAIILGFLVSVVYLLIYAFFTYRGNPQIDVVICSDVVYLIGVNLMGVYFRLMNEVVTRRSFLDRRACVESTLQPKFVKDQEERLMLSILPEHIVSRVRHDIRNMFLGIRSRTLSQSMKSLNQRYVEEHDNVSILYADVVNYTMISTSLSPMRMVELLNELFGRFDEASEEQDVLRIKFLGDCYYCVSGVPKPSDQHAKNCVDLGLEMIHIIKDVREKRALNIDMRIGVHSGKILSGLIGIRKWQYDIWSKDVTIASKMESTGKAGKVHVTKQTLELLLDYAREYIIEPNFESQNDPFILKHKLETYLISRPPRVAIEYKPYRRVSVGLNKLIQSKSSRRADIRSSANIRRTTSFMDENLVEYQQMLKAADAQMAKEIEDMSNGKDHLIKDAAFNNITLMYKDLSMAKGFLALPDPLFKYYILCCLFILSLMLLINGLTTNWLQGFPWYACATLFMLILGLVILQPLTWFQFLWTKHRGYEEPKNNFLRKIYDISANITRSAMIRTIIYLIHVTQCWGLALLLNFLFSRVFFILKWIVAILMTSFYLWIVWEVRTSLFAKDATWNVGLDPRVSHTLCVVFITITLYWIDRTTEYRNSLDHLWQMQLSAEQKEAETMLRVNNMLLENILPAHVVQVYLDLNRSIDELYYEKYDNVTVMFASLTDYKLGEEKDSDFSDKYLLRILDEVISDFDRLLMMGTSAHKIEKIKMAGWTYMAACGLDPSRRDSFDSMSFNTTDKNHNNPYNKAIVLTMVEFAAAMMMHLQNFNRGSFQKFEGINLRIGISNGEVAAGVVGSLKPLYDIWGNAVNMASRMDSTGEPGKIQVTENTAMILDDCGILTTNRGEIFVKGAGYIKTYFVPLDEQFNLIKKENSIEYYRKQERNRYYDIRNAMLSDNLFITVEEPTFLATYDIRDLSVASDFEDDFEGDRRSCLSMDDSNTGLSSNARRTITLPDDEKKISDLFEETRC